MQSALDKLTILHFNDIYNIEEAKTDPVGGAARFKTALDSFKHLDPLILFSGDLFHPSLLGTLYNGEQMIKPVNDFGVAVACFGNHEFDLEMDTLTELIKKTNFPWLLSNVKDVKTLEPLCSGKEYHVLTKNGLKIGFVGLAEQDWLYVTESIEEEDVVFEDFLVCSKRLTKILREEHQCDLIIALTHMRTYNDIKLAELFTEFDLILGGHDHINNIEEVNRTWVIKSGCDFKEFNKITMTIPQSRLPSNSETIKRADDYSIYDAKCKVETENIYVTTAFEPEPSIKAHVDHYFELFQESMKLPMFYAECELETRFAKIRRSEQNLPNFLADIMRLETESDCSLINTGLIRSDLVFQRGILKLGDVRLLLPCAGDLILKVEMTGEQLLKSLENGVSKYPALEGRWPALSGVSFEFDPKKEAGKRINVETLRIRNGPIDLKERYTMASNEWIVYGKDGYDALAGVKILIDESVAEEPHVILKRFFELGHDASFLEIWQAEKEEKHASSKERICHKKLHFFEKLKSLIHDIVEHEGNTYVAIKPQIEGRIRIVEG